MLVREVPTYCLPVSDARTELLHREDGVAHSPGP
jgi:hypothetical protein